MGTAHHHHVAGLSKMRERMDLRIVQPSTSRPLSPILPYAHKIASASYGCTDPPKRREPTAVFYLVTELSDTDGVRALAGADALSALFSSRLHSEA
ncbi:hypothetical protein T10_3118 [Trichinella papuae]|uniref:Uncharacterized protein n=1 Tax=Trichinella papuae TaxID=268474 RepID=A0A0V1MTC7_9BILA|nr:hypothetical protein T10_3118 [Trichinella papuae]